LLQEFRPTVRFCDVTFEFIASFEHFLHARGFHINTIAKHLKHLRRYVNCAVDRGYITPQSYAFRKYKIKTAAYRHTHLIPTELRRLEQLQLTGRYQKYQHTLDAFLFCCYTGMRYSDFINQSAHNLIELAGCMWMVYQSVKTAVEVRLPLYLLFGGSALGILERYRPNLSAFFRLKNNSNINKELALIARQASLSKHLSFHTARHTNATLLIYKGVSITTVQQLLGHKHIRTTQTYTHVMDSTIVRDLEKVWKL
jgi:site-specific recombinase XerD